MSGAAPAEPGEPGEPAGPGTPVALPHTWRPVVARVVTLALAVVALGSAATVYALLPAEVQGRFSALQLLTLVAFLAAGAWILYVVARGRVTADADGLTVVNMLRTRRVAWSEVRRVRMRPGDPWVLLDLTDGTVLAATGIQASDGARGRRAAAELTAVAAAMRSRGGG